MSSAHGIDGHWNSAWAIGLTVPLPGKSFWASMHSKRSSLKHSPGRREIGVVEDASSPSHLADVTG